MSKAEPNVVPLCDVLLVLLIIFMVKEGNKHFFVAYVEVCVACGQSVAFIADGFRHGQLYDLQFIAVLVD